MSAIDTLKQVLERVTQLAAEYQKLQDAKDALLNSIDNDPAVVRQEIEQLRALRPQVEALAGAIAKADDDRDTAYTAAGEEVERVDDDTREKLGDIESAADWLDEIDEQIVSMEEWLADPDNLSAEEEEKGLAATIAALERAA